MSQRPQHAAPEFDVPGVIRKVPRPAPTPKAWRDSLLPSLPLPAWDSMVAEYGNPFDETLDEARLLGEVR